MAIDQNKNNSLRFFEQIYAMVGLLHMIGASGPFFFNFDSVGRSRLSSTLVTEGTLGTQILGAGIYLIALMLLLPRLKDVINLLSRNKALVLFVGLIMISALWSDLPSVTLRRSIALTGTTIFAVYLALRFSAGELLKMLALALGLTAVESLLLVFLAPDVAVHRYANYGAWKGALGQKNIMGRTMVLGMLVLWAVAPQVRAYRTLLWSVFALCLFLVVMSQSRTSWIVSAGLILTVPFLYYFQRSQIPVMVRVLLVTCAGLGVLGFIVIEYADIGLQAVGRDDTFSGRTDIWAAAIDVGSDKPLLGHGYRTFWTLGLTNRLLIGNGHNSFLDLWLELGLVGLGLFIASLVITGRRALQRLAHTNDRRGQLYIMFLLFLIVFGMAAQVFPDHGTIPWVLYIVISMYLTPFTAAQTIDQMGHRRQLTTPQHQPAPAE
ncbi:MAG: O-antigen ligase family protein [Alphaproteobacteria bacterium]